MAWLREAGRQKGKLLLPGEFWGEQSGKLFTPCVVFQLNTANCEGATKVKIVICVHTVWQLDASLLGM